MTGSANKPRMGHLDTGAAAAAPVLLSQACKHSGSYIGGIGSGYGDLVGVDGPFVIEKVV